MAQIVLNVVGSFIALAVVLELATRAVTRDAGEGRSGPIITPLIFAAIAIAVLEAIIASGLLPETVSSLLGRPILYAMAGVMGVTVAKGSGIRQAQLPDISIDLRQQFDKLFARLDRCERLRQAMAAIAMQPKTTKMVVHGPLQELVQELRALEQDVGRVAENIHLSSSSQQEDQSRE